MRAEGPSTVYTPPPGKSPDDPLRGSPGGAATTADEPRTWRRLGKQQADAQFGTNVQPDAATDRTGISASTDVDGPTSLEPWENGSDLWERDGGAAPGPAATSSAHARSGRRSREKRELRLNGGSNVAPGAAGSDGGSQGDAGMRVLQKPSRGNAQSVAGRIYRPRWRAGSTEVGSSRQGDDAHASQSTGSESSAGTVAREPREGSWDVAWGNGGGRDGAGVEWRNEADVSSAFSEGGAVEGNGGSSHDNGSSSSSGSDVGVGRGGSGSAAAAGGGVIKEDEPDSAHVVR